MSKIKEKKDKKLFECKSVFNLEEYQKMFLNFPIAFYQETISSLLKYFILLVIISVILKSSISEFLITYLLIIVLKVIINKLRIKSIATRHFKKNYKNNLNLNIQSNTIFYEKYLVRKTNNQNQQIKYSDIKLIKENNTNFYIGTEKAILVFQKEYCSDKLIKFIKNINKENKILIKGKKYKN